VETIFKALADPTRRAVLDRLFDRNGQTLGELSEGLTMTRQGVSKHLAILEDAGLVVTERKGREKRHFLNPVPIHQVHDRWIRKFETGRLDALDELRRRLEGGEESE
jgi:DNA-binding transcriptional ArsR family regulator